MDKRILDLNLEMSIMSHNGIVHFGKQFNPLIMGTPRHISIMDRVQNALFKHFMHHFERQVFLNDNCRVQHRDCSNSICYIPSSNKDLTLSFVSAEVANVVQKYLILLCLLFLRVLRYPAILQSSRAHCIVP